ncbi:basic salivary proline-rich protein 3-like [Gouania willdenowi]|uniref:basic salivary proline-rich protein 3-like n=1 Tax=Gouania willdenowi TaxID=441366 RepID=UPI001056A6C4|nr:basic salivary proline-rich protein 3-like [Gouania willdenowi]
MLSKVNTKREPPTRDPSRGAKAHAQQMWAQSQQGQDPGPEGPGIEAAPGAARPRTTTTPPAALGNEGTLHATPPAPRRTDPAPQSAPGRPFLTPLERCPSVIAKVSPPPHPPPGAQPDCHTSVRHAQTRGGTLGTAQAEATPRCTHWYARARPAPPTPEDPRQDQPSQPAKPSGPQEHAPGPGTPKGETPGEAPWGVPPPPNPAHEPATVKQRKPQGNATHRRVSDRQPPPQEGGTPTAPTQRGTAVPN